MKKRDKLDMIRVILDGDSSYIESKWVLRSEYDELREIYEHEADVLKDEIDLLSKRLDIKHDALNDYLEKLTACRKRIQYLEDK